MRCLLPGSPIKFNYKPLVIASLKDGNWQTWVGTMGTLQVEGQNGTAALENKPAASTADEHILQPRHATPE